MKIVYSLTLFLLFSCTSFSQTELPVKLRAVETANPWLGKAWDNKYTPLKEPINISFDGTKLLMTYDSGKVYADMDIDSYERKESKKYDKLESEVFILKYQEKGFSAYILIEKSYYYGDVFIQIKIPFISETGEIMSYSYYQEF